MKYYTIDKITHRPTGKFYIGRHQTSDLNDGYMGSGSYIRAALQKYPPDQFNKEYLYIFYDPYYMYLYEEAIVTEKFCARDDTYNIAPGGFGGGFQYINDNGLNTYDGKSDLDKSKLVLAREKLKHLRKDQPWSDRYSKSMSESLKGNQSFLGKSHTEETKLKIGKASSKHQAGTGNSQFGSMWITNGDITRKIKKCDQIPVGWRQGRK